MRKRINVLAAMGAWATMAAAQAPAANDPALLKDMTAVVALLGVPCGQVVAVTTVKENDHVVTCQDGNRYRVFLNAEGRVVAQRSPG